MMKITTFSKRALAVVSVAVAATLFSPAAFAKDKAPSDDGVWFGGAEEFYEDFTPEAVKRNEKEQEKAEEKAKKNAEKAKKRREKEVKAAEKRDRKLEKLRTENEARDARRAEKAQKKMPKDNKPAEAVKQKKDQPGELLPSDLTYKGLSLGDNVEAMHRCLGEPDFDQEVGLYGIPLRYYVYGRKLRVGVFETMAGVTRVVDIVIRDEDYKARNGIRYGSTPYHVFQTYGRGQRQPIDSRLYYVFESEEPGYKRLLIEYQAPTNMVVSMRITSLPLSEGEADRRFEEFEPAALATDVGALMIRQKEIDTSELDISVSPPQINIAVD